MTNATETNAVPMSVRRWCAQRDSSGMSWYHKVNKAGTACTYCKSKVIVIETGVWTAQPWRQDGRYSLEHAVRTFKTEAAADKFTDALYAESRANVVSVFVRCDA